MLAFSDFSQGLHEAYADLVDVPPSELVSRCEKVVTKLDAFR